MGRVALLRGQCAVFKNGSYQDSMASSMFYDSDSKTFQMYFDDNPWGRFRPIQVTAVTVYSSVASINIAYQTVPLPLKSYHLGIYVQFGPNDNFVFVYNFNDEENAKGWKSVLEKYLPRQNAAEEVLILLKTREKVPLNEVAAILGKYGLPSTADDSRRAVESEIVAGKIHGIIEGGEFLSQSALQRESIRYEVLTKLELGKNGVLSLTCPKCGATIPVGNKASEGKCAYCGSAYTVPRRILDSM